MALRRLIFMLVFVLGGAASLSAQLILDQPSELQGIDVEEHLGESIPLDLVFTDDTGQAVTLAQYFTADKPVLLTLNYYRCPMLCSLILNGAVEAIKPLHLIPGEDFQWVTVSIDPRETAQLAAAKKKMYLESLGKSVPEEGWAFLVGTAANIDALASAVGYQYYYDKTNDQYAHPAVLTFLSPEGKITRYLYGLTFNTQDVRLALLEASEGKIGNTIDKLILSCFHYDPDAKGYVVLASNVMRLGGILTIIVLTVFLSSFWVKEHVRRPHSGRSERVKETV
ncbi:MAG: SCO family protein [Gemmatimonadetes bacterium]|nr:MAG: SCO family protein [Gemmatimonadota bacterium]